MNDRPPKDPQRAPGTLAPTQLAGALALPGERFLDPFLEVNCVIVD